jgi:hypothetical protein
MDKGCICMLPTVCAGKSSGNSHYLWLIIAGLQLQCPCHFAQPTSVKISQTCHPYLSPMTASYYISRQTLALPPLQLHNTLYHVTERGYDKFRWYTIGQPRPMSILSFTFLTHIPFWYVQGYVWVDDWHSHSVTGVHSINIQMRFHQPVLQNYVSACIAVGCSSPGGWYDAVVVAAKHRQVTSVFMWGLFALCGLYYSSSMLKQIHIYFKLRVFTVSSDDTFSLQECNVNKYVYTDLFIYSGTPNTMISVPLVYCMCMYVYTHTHTHTFIKWQHCKKWKLWQHWYMCTWICALSWLVTSA